MKKYKKMIVDIVTNIVSYGFPILLLQFVVLPLLGRVLDTKDYGLILSITGVASVISEMTCGTLANVRILENDKYQEINRVGLFKTLFLFLIVFSSIAIFLITILAYHVSLSVSVFFLIYYILISTRAYYLAAYRIVNNYRAVFINNIVMCIGYIIGIIIFKYIISFWPIVYVIPALLACLHIYLSTNLYKERPIIDKEISSLVKEDTSLMVSYLVGSGMNYFDRIYLYPAIGSAAVSNYYVSTLMGKILSMINGPLNMVVLSYIAKVDTINRKFKAKVIIFLSIFGALFAFFSIIISPYVITFFYPQYYSNTVSLIPIVTIAITIFNISSILRVVSMKTIGYNYILLIECIYAVVYIALSLILVNRYFLEGFCIATLVASIVRYVIYVSINLFMKDLHSKYV